MVRAVFGSTTNSSPAPAEPFGPPFAASGRSASTRLDIPEVTANDGAVYKLIAAEFRDDARSIRSAVARATDVRPGPPRM